MVNITIGEKELWAEKRGKKERKVLTLGAVGVHTPTSLLATPLCTPHA